MGSRKQAAQNRALSLDFTGVGKPLEGVREQIYIFKDDPATSGKKDFAEGQTISTLIQGYLFLSPHYMCRGGRASVLMKT